MIITDMDSSTDAARPFMVNIENVGHECPTYGYDYKTSAGKRANPTEEGHIGCGRGNDCRICDRRTL